MSSSELDSQYLESSRPFCSDLDIHHNVFEIDMAPKMRISDRLSGLIQRTSLKLKAKVNPHRFGVTVVVTSCNRHALLDKTLASFFEINTFPISKVIVVEDGPEPARGLEQKYSSEPIEWIATGQRVGQIAAIDYAYSRLKTPYIFHMEDDWEFYKSGFIEKSLQILCFDPKCLQIWIRALDDTNGHPCETSIHSKNGVRWRRMALDYQKGKWHGFSFNPGLRRLSDYIATGGFGNLTSFDFHDPWKTEIEIGRFYRQRGFYAGILVDNNQNGYVKHIGDDHHTPPPSEPT